MYFTQGKIRIVEQSNNHTWIWRDHNNSWGGGGGALPPSPLHSLKCFLLVCVFSPSILLMFFFLSKPHDLQSDANCASAYTREAMRGRFLGFLLRYILELDSDHRPSYSHVHIVRAAKHVHALG